MARNLRIAASVFFGLLTLALCALWVTSYWYRVYVGHNIGAYTSIEANTGRARLVRSPDFGTLLTPYGWNMGYESANVQVGREWFNGDGGIFISIPMWALAFVTAVLTYYLWPSARFSLRSMFIVTAIVAIILGLRAYIYYS